MYLCRELTSLIQLLEEKASHGVEDSLRSVNGNGALDDGDKGMAVGVRDIVDALKGDLKSMEQEQVYIYTYSYIHIHRDSLIDFSF